MTNSTRESRQVLFAKLLLVSSLTVSVLLSIVLGLRHTRWAVVAPAILVVLFALLLYLDSGPPRRSKLGLALLVSSLNAMLIPELALYSAGFRYESGIQFGFPRPYQLVTLAPDPSLFWKRRPSDPGVNSLGFLGEEFVTPKPAGRFRMVFLGDSCTEQGFPGIVEVLLNGSSIEPRFESVSLAVAGYSSYQGRILAEEYALDLEPDLVMVYFGWNDHWQAYRTIDSKKTMPADERPGSTLQSFLRSLRMVQASQWLLRRLTDPTTEAIPEARVPPNEYRDNLLHIHRVLHRRGIPVLFVTAPTSHYRLGFPKHLVAWKFVPDGETGKARHRQYNAIVRSVAEETGAYLLDLESELDARQDLDRVFYPDGIHFHEAGLALVANRIADFVGSRVLVARGRPGVGSMPSDAGVAAARH